MHRRIDIIKKYFWVYEIEIYLSAKSGFHCYIRPYRDIPDWKYFSYRRKFKDDGFRLVEDVFFRKGKSYSNVMFERKTEHGFVFQEEPLFKYTRTMKGFSGWKFQNLERAISV